MNRITDTIKEVQYRRLLKRSFEPRKEFLQSSREAFLSEVAKRRVAPLAPQLPWHALGMNMLRYGAVACVFALAGTTGLVAYADNTNVGVKSALYPLKRVGEQVRLVTTPAVKEPELRKELAQRRASELFEIEEEKQPDVVPTIEQLRKIETREAELRTDFRQHIEKIEERKASDEQKVEEQKIYTAEKQDTKNGEKVAEIVVESSLCQVTEAVEKHSDNGKSERYKKFQERCKKILEKESEYRNFEKAVETVFGETTTEIKNAEHAYRQELEKKKAESEERAKQE